MQTGLLLTIGAAADPFTTTCWAQVLVLPFKSVTVHTTAIVPMGNVADGWSLVTLAIPQLSLVVGVPNAGVAVHWPGAKLMLISAGHVMLGASTSCTVTTKVQAELPTLLVAVAVTDVVPTGNTLPGFWL